MAHVWSIIPVILVTSPSMGIIGYTDKTNLSCTRGSCFLSHACCILALFTATNANSVILVLGPRNPVDSKSTNTKVCIGCVPAISQCLKETNKIVAKGDYTTEAISIYYILVRFLENTDFRKRFYMF